MNKALLPFLLISLCGVAQAQEPETADKALIALRGELAAKTKVYRNELRNGDEKTRARLKDQDPPAIVYEEKFLNFSKSHPKSNAARLALIWVAKRGSGRGASAKAIVELLKNHWDDPLVYQVFPGITYHPDANDFYQSILSRSKHKTAQAHACYYLARALANSTDYAILDDKETKRTIQLLNRAQGEFKEILGVRKVKAMATCLYKMKYLQIGQVAPEIRGVDVNDKAHKLSDYRGKVVLLIFWGDW